MKNKQLVKQIIMEILEDYVDKIITSKEKKEASLKAEAPLKSEAPLKAEAQEKKEVLQKPITPININKMAQENALNYLKTTKKKVSQYV